MPRVDSRTKDQRKERCWLKVKRHPNGITEAEIADFVGLDRRAVNNYLRELEDAGKIYRENTLWYPLNFEGTRLRSFDLSPEEAYTLYLATRLLVKQHDKRNEPAETALLKLAHVLTSDAGIGREIEQAAQELASRPSRPEYHSVFHTMVQGYIYHKQVAIRYRPLNGRSFETSFSTYLMEPSAIGYATYAIGHSSLPDQLRSYKLERVEAARLTGDSYHIPADFPGLDILRHAWSIIFGDDLVEVVLRFHPRVRARVLESRWHPSERTADDPDHPGYLIWQAQVADTKDMVPWIRAWGADAELLAPLELRRELTRETRRQMRLYGLEDVTNHGPSADDYDDRRASSLFR